MIRILIVDDEKMERDGVEFLIRRRSLPVRIRQAQNGQEALDMWRDEPYDIVFMDIKMPVMNGIELCRNIRESNGNTVLVVLSAYGDFAYTQKAIQMRVDDYLLKPVSIEEFDNVLDNAMDLVRQRRNKAAENPPPASLSEYRQDKQVADSLAQLGDHNRERRIIAEVMHQVEEHYAENIGLEWAASRVDLSPGYLSGFFKRAYGKSFTQYLTGVRMEKAKEYLTTTHMRIADISTAVGYSNPSYFCLQFKKFYGVTANQMRDEGEPVKPASTKG